MEGVNKWTRSKWALILSVLTVFVYGTAGLVCAIMIWFKTWDYADVMYVADNDVLILITLAALILLFTALIGMTGTLLNSRPLLAVYALLLWPALIALAAIGYTSYKRATYALDRKLSLAWSQYYTPLGRLLIQNALHCCGFYNPLHESTPSARCFPRTPFPGCKGALVSFERSNLGAIWSAAFSVAALHLINIVVALLCANHITDRFGKGIMPKQYRLSDVDVKANAEKILATMVGMDGAFRQDREECEPLLST
ncbi:Tetraspanin family-domain-containing protein [Schizophyllum amplum]|uniref:Tetraspanin family-domain-containing protein n=1 Tax=Schizophyllum amplum TaxID=97359 RepID=A0A550BWK2_9AGAR|nr:Tetraspanin family-domain-containing protein [Auriculariopsis ampla]